MIDELAKKLAERLHYLTWSEDMNGYFMTEEELKEEILDIANDFEDDMPTNAEINDLTDMGYEN